MQVTLQKVHIFKFIDTFVLLILGRQHSWYAQGTKLSQFTDKCIH